MYFDAAEQKIAELDTRTAALEGQSIPDLAPLQADLDAVKAAVTALQAAVAALDARLDAIAAGAQG